MVLGIVGVAVVLLMAATVRESSFLRRPETFTSKHNVPSLPGYSGWARPSSTMANMFRIINPSNQTAKAGSDWEIELACDACASFVNPSTLFVRAYGPAILTGTVQSKRPDIYTLALHPMHTGKYTLEVVVTYSLGIDFSSYPLSAEQLPPQYYEGYLVDGFPFEFQVLPNKKTSTQQTRASMCDKADLLFNQSSKADLWKRGTWMIASTIRDKSFGNNNNSVTLAGYQSSQNSIGFTAEYEMNSGCRLSESIENQISCNSKRMRVILIGDSVMRLQRDVLQAHLDPARFEIVFLELYGGILYCSRVSGPNISKEADNFADEVADMENIVIFNSGMHDIHRLCGHQYAEERRTYLSDAEMAMPCTEVYKRAMTELAITVRQIPAIARVFQTTHAAWPKYGNYGVAWDPRYAQELPLDSAFVERFNDIAIEVVEQLNTQSSTLAARIVAVDTFWMTLARPDNRETSKNADIGKKLSHPGQEVTFTMVRILWQAVLRLVCDPL